VTKAVETVKHRSLNKRMEAFAMLYASLNSDTFGQGIASARKAGYAESACSKQASLLTRNALVKARMQELYSEQVEGAGITRPKVLADIEHTRRQALAKGDLATAARCSELHGKYLAMFTDVTVDLDVQREMSDTLRLESRRLSKLMLTGQVVKGLPAPDVVEGEVVDDGQADGGSAQGESAGGRESIPACGTPVSAAHPAGDDGLPAAAEQQSEDAEPGDTGEDGRAGQPVGNAGNAAREEASPPNGPPPRESITSCHNFLGLGTH